MEQGKWTTIRVRVDVKNRLESLMKMLGAKSLSEVVKILIDEYEKSTRDRVRTIMCNDLSEASASYVGWARLLVNKGLKPNEIAIALEFLSGSIDELRVDKAKCI